MALVHPVEALEDLILIRGRDADAGVRHRELHGSRELFHGHRDTSAGTVVLDGVVAEVVDHLMQQLPDAHDLPALSLQGEMHVLPGGDGAQTVQHVPGDCVQIHRLLFRQAGVFVQLGELQNILDQGDQTLGLPVDVGGELPHLVRRDAALGHQLGKAGDGGQGRFQLVRDVGGELLPQPFPLGAFGDVHPEQHRAHDGAAGSDRACDQLPAAAVDLQLRLLVAAAEGGLCGGLCLLVGELRVVLVQIRQQLPGAGVGAEHLAALVHQQEALAHAVGQSGEFLLLPVQGLHLLVVGQTQLLQAGDQGRELRVHRRLLRVIQVQLVDGLDDLLRGPGGQQTGHGQHQHEDPQHRGQRHQGRVDCADGAGQAHHGAVLCAQGVEDAGARLSFGSAEHLALSVPEGGLHLLQILLVG